MNRQRYMAELSKLLTFMFKEDRAEILQHYNELLDNAEDEQALLEEFGSPTKLAVTISRTYSREERKLSVSVDSKVEESEDREYTKPDESQFRTIKPAQAVEEEVDYLGSYAEIVEEIRREMAEENGVEYVPIFFDNPEPENEAEPETEEVEEETAEVEEGEEEVPEETEDEAETESESEELTEDDDASTEETQSEEENSSEESEAEPEDTEAEVAEEEEESESEESEEDAPAEEDAPEEESDEEDNSADSEDEASEEAEADENSEETEAESEEDSEEKESESEETEAVPLTEESDVEEPVEAVQRVIPEIPDYTTDFLKEAEEEKISSQKLSPALLVLYLIFAIPIGLVLLILTAAVTLTVLGGGAAAMAGGVLLVAFSLSGITVTADIMLIVGGALIAFGLGILLLWTGFWLIIAGFKNLINGIVKLGRKICVKGAEW